MPKILKQKRYSRSYYWIGLFAVFGAFTLILALVGVSFKIFSPSMLETPPIPGEMPLLPLIIALFPLIGGIFMGIKRLHDLNRSGWWSLLILIPYLNFVIYFLLLGFIKGTDGENRYGADPLETRST